MKGTKKSAWKHCLLPDSKLREAMELYPGKTRTEVQDILWKELAEKLAVGAAAMIFFLILAVCLAGSKKDSQGIVRPAPGASSIKQEVLLWTEDNWKSFELEIGALEFTEEQIEALHRKVVQYLEAVVLAENESWESVKTDLLFPEKIPEETGKIYWSTDNSRLLTAEGEVKNIELTSPEQVKITAKIYYGSEFRCFSKLVTVCPIEYTKEETVLRQVQLELCRREQESRTAERFVLPESVLGHVVKEAEESGFGVSTFFVMLAVVVPLLLYSNYFGTLDSRQKKRKEQAESGYLGFVTKLSFMMAAGITVRQAFGRLAEEYEKTYGDKHMLTAELKVTKQELDTGHSEQEAYEAFGQRVGVLAYRRLASLLTQNVSRGVQGIRNLLLLEAKEVMAQERAGIKEKGEQAGTKLLFPMMGLLFLVFAILLVPAFQTF